MEVVNGNNNNNIIPRTSPLKGKLFDVNLKARFQIKKNDFV
jgi:hypothetical protein